MRYLSFLAIPLILVLVSCEPETVPQSPEVPPTPVLTSSSTWGVVNIPYLKMLEESDPSSGVSGLLRQGDVVEVLAKVGLGDGLDYWLEIRSDEEQGWVPDDALNVYDSRAQAVTASAGITGDG